MKALLRLYPSTWRARYEAEVTAVLEQRGSRLTDALDIIRGALDAHLHPVAAGDPSASRGGASMSLRHAGWAAVIGGALWSVAYLGVYLTARIVSWANQETGQGIAASEGQYWLASLLVAPALLVAAQVWVARSLSFRRPRSWIPVISLLGASVMTAKLLVNAIRPDRALLGDRGQAELWVVGMLVLVMASFAFGLVLLATGAVPRRATALLLVGSLLNAAFLAITGAAHWRRSRTWP